MSIILINSVKTLIIALSIGYFKENGDERVFLNVDHDDKGLWRVHATYSCCPVATLSTIWMYHESSHIVSLKFERIRSDSSQIPIAEGHGAVSGTNFKKNQKSKTPYLVHYKLCHLKEWLSSTEKFDLDCYYIDEVSSSITTGCISFFRNIFTLTSSYSSIYIFMNQKSYTTT